jgi:hypothetical protein
VGANSGEQAASIGDRTSLGRETAFAEKWCCAKMRRTPHFSGNLSATLSRQLGMMLAKEAEMSLKYLSGVEVYTNDRIFSATAKPDWSSSYPETGTLRGGPVALSLAHFARPRKCQCFRLGVAGHVFVCR